MEQSLEEKKNGRLKWWIVAASFIMVFTCLGFCSSTKGLYLAAITEALHLERGLFSINDSIRFLTTAALNLFFGKLIARFGPRKLAMAGFAALTTLIRLDLPTFGNPTSPTSASSLSSSVTSKCSPG